MPTLYVKTGCPYCAKVLDAAEGLGIELDTRNIADDAVAEELVARGGKRQVPYLVDEEGGVEMYESDAIVAHLNSRFSPASGE
jgi:glutaredoxin